MIRRDAKAVAFQVGAYAPDIACVREELQKQGLGSALFKAALARARRDDIDVMYGECAPKTSWPFWQKHGFERYRQRNMPNAFTVRLILKRTFPLLDRAREARVSISFLPEDALYNDGVGPLGVHEVMGARLPDGRVQLSERVIGFWGDEPEGRDLAVRIVVDGVEVCFVKAKYPEAAAAGVEVGDRLFFIDVVVPKAV